MNEQKFENEIERRWGRHRSGNGNIWTGLFLLLIGALLFARTAGVFIPWWVFTWPMFLIALSLFIGVRHGLRSGGWIIMFVVGAIFLADKISPTLYMRPYMWPVLLIIAGLFIMAKPKSRFGGSCRNRRSDDTMDGFTSTHSNRETGATDHAIADHADVLDITAIFAGIKKRVLSKNFKGGDIVAVMGGTEVNLTQADFNGRITIDSFTMFGGNKLIIPPDWEVQSEVVAIFGGIEDKRPPATQYNPGKLIFLQGTCVFGGITIKSF